jgi:NADPH-dependent 2,4-dienoyl-CoA reductase/sulfur reductase-like enzyme
MEQMQAQAEHVGAQMMWDQIVEIDLSRRPFRLVGDGGTVYSGDVLVIATGAQAKWLQMPVRGASEGPRCLRLRDLRRLLLPRQEGGGDRRRQYRGRGSALPHQSQP